VRKRCWRPRCRPKQDLKAIDAEVREIVNEAADFAQHEPEPDPSELYTDLSLRAGADFRRCQFKS
jgi:pyruvate dehydrogenase E1 component alpha subunit